jgi:hypothetical protein
MKPSEKLKWSNLTEQFWVRVKEITRFKTSSLCLLVSRILLFWYWPTKCFNPVDTLTLIIRTSGENQRILPESMKNQNS